SAVSADARRGRLAANVLSQAHVEVLDPVLADVEVLHAVEEALIGAAPLVGFEVLAAVPQRQGDSLVWVVGAPQQLAEPQALDAATRRDDLLAVGALVLLPHPGLYLAPGYTR